LPLTSVTRSTAAAPPAEGGLGDLRLLRPGESDFPSGIIEHLGAAVPRLWARGQLGALRITPRVTVVGSRGASARGLTQARALGRALAEQGALLISGGALGIDAAAHEGALEGGGSTCAVLGTGVDLAYPAGHARLFSRIARAGCLLSMFELGTPPARPRFPQRNRLMAALADLVVVVEAQLRSGTESTARAARRFGRRLVCFPHSPGTAALLPLGAQAVESPAEVLALLSGAALHDGEPPRASGNFAELAGSVESAEHFLPLSSSALRLAGALCESAVDLGELCARTGLVAAECAAALIELELCGRCSRLPGGRYIGHSPLS
jgi:DNA processing protein